MGIVELLLLAVGLSMDAFAVSVCKGLSLPKIETKHMVIAGAWFGGFQALMPLIGYFLGSLFAEKMEQWDHWIAFVLLMIIGAGMLKEAFEEGEEKVEAKMDPKTMFLLAVATSIDALAVGVTFAFLKTNILLSVSLIGVVTFCFSAVGIRMGSRLGSHCQKKAEIAGGMILMLLAAKILLEGLGIL